MVIVQSAFLSGADMCRRDGEKRREWFRDTHTTRPLVAQDEVEAAQGHSLGTLLLLLCKNGNHDVHQQGLGRRRVSSPWNTHSHGQEGGVGMH